LRVSRGSEKIAKKFLKNLTLAGIAVFISLIFQGRGMPARNRLSKKFMKKLLITLSALAASAAAS